MSKYTGIDYGLGTSNIDKDTGIRYGVIAQNTLGPEAANEVWLEGAVYIPCCPHCGEPNEEHNVDGAADVCSVCDKDVEDWEYGDEPSYIEYHEQTPDGEIIILDCLDTNFMIIKSPFTTIGPFCSPCVPGAVDLDSADGTFGTRAYCLPNDWFDNDAAPYSYRKEPA